MRIIGLTGGIASGKSTVAKMIEARGVRVVDSDVLAREAVAVGSTGLAEVAAAFGPGVLLADGALDRAALGDIIFHDPQQRAVLNGIVHPRVRAGTAEQTQAAFAAGASAVVWDVPLLFESGIDAAVDRTLVVWVDGDTQRSRLMARNQLSRADADARIASQMPLDVKRGRAHYLIDNGASLSETEAQLDAVWSRLFAAADPN